MLRYLLSLYTLLFVRCHAYLFGSFKGSDENLEASKRTDKVFIVTLWMTVIFFILVHSSILGLIVLLAWCISTGQAA